MHTHQEGHRRAGLCERASGRARESQCSHPNWFQCKQGCRKDKTKTSSVSGSISPVFATLMHTSRASVTSIWRKSTRAVGLVLPSRSYLELAISGGVAGERARQKLEGLCKRRAAAAAAAVISLAGRGLSERHLEALNCESDGYKIGVAVCFAQQISRPILGSAYFSVDILISLVVTQRADWRKIGGREKSLIVTSMICVYSSADFKPSGRQLARLGRPLVRPPGAQTLRVRCNGRQWREGGRDESRRECRRTEPKDRRHRVGPSESVRQVACRLLGALSAARKRQSRRAGWRLRVKLELRAVVWHHLRPECRH